MQIDDYVAEIPEARRGRVMAIIDLILSLYPDATASMRYRTPTFETESGWVSVANQKSYISLYTCAEVHIAEFKAKHPEIKTGKGCINFRDSDDIPLEDLRSVISSAMESRHPLP